MCLAERIIDDSCPANLLLPKLHTYRQNVTMSHEVTLCIFPLSYITSNFYDLHGRAMAWYLALSHQAYDKYYFDVVDPHGRPTVTAGIDHCFRIYTHFSQNKFQAKTMFATGETVGLAEWIIDDTCLVCTYISPFCNIPTGKKICITRGY